MKTVFILFLFTLLTLISCKSGGLIPLEESSSLDYNTQNYSIKKTKAMELSQIGRVNSAISLLYDIYFQEEYTYYRILGRNSKPRCSSDEYYIILRKKYSNEYLKKELDNGIKNFSYEEKIEVDSSKSGEYKLHLEHKSVFPFLNDSIIFSSAIKKTYRTKEEMINDTLIYNGNAIKPKYFLKYVKESPVYKCSNLEK
jgi:hypothetical protein